MFSDESKENSGLINSQIPSTNQGRFFSLQDLQNGCPNDVDPSKKEMWLSGFRNIAKKNFVY